MMFVTKIKIVGCGSFGFEVRDTVTRDGGFAPRLELHYQVQCSHKEGRVEEPSPTLSACN